MDYVQLVDLENLTPGFEIDFGEDDDDIEEIHVSSDDDKLYESADGNLPLRSRKATNDAQECQPNASSLVAESLSRLPQNERQLSTLKWLRGQSAGTLEFPSPSGDQGADLSSEYEEGNSLLSSLNLSRVLRRRSSLPLEVAAASSGKQRFTPSSSQILPNDSGFAGENYNRCNPQRKTAPPSRRKAVGNTAAATYPPPSFGPSQAPHRHASHARHHSVAEANTRSGARKSHRITARAKGNGAGQETADVNYPITPFTATVRMTSMDKPTHAPAPIITTPTDTPADYRHDFAHPSEHSSDVAQDDGPRAPPPTTALQGIPSLERTDRRHILALAKELPLHVLTVAGKLELALCREQEDFASGNLKEFCPPALRAELHFLIRNLIFVQKVAASLSAACSSPEDEAQIAAELDTLTNEFSHMYLTSADVLLYFRQTGMNAIFPQLMKRLDWEYRNPGRNYVYHQFEQGDVPGATNDLDEEGGSVLDEVDTATLGNQLPQSIILSAATIPKSTLTHRVIEDGESAPYGRQSGFCGHLEHMSAVNQVVVTATQLYYRLESEFVPKSDIIAKDRIYASGDIIAHQLSVLYHSLGGEFKKYRPHVEKHFNIAKSWGTLSHSVARRKSGPSGGANESEDKGMAEYIDKLKLLLAEIVTDALYSAKAKVELPESRFPPLIHGGARDADGRRHGARESRWVVPAPIHNVTAHSILRYLNYELPPPPKKRESGATGNKGRTNLEHRKGNKHHTNSDNGKGGGGGGGGRPPIPPFLADRTAKPSL
ncbi:hypothetical protein EV182_002376 [Spiromyces aspiralis]|uniref:Uncharacterized protein n=1 Tax=Spiromyces aspiralis TaxID=68401 RepID=A0ACC1HFC5_9FUNG|nr:hypothetical protein EV182_002376 [Spiromyces aspiralis]